MLMSAFLLPTLVCGTAFLVNFIAIYYHASRSTAHSQLWSPSLSPHGCVIFEFFSGQSCSQFDISHQKGKIFRAIPFGTMVAVSCICLFVILPLTLVGSVLGRNLAGDELKTQNNMLSTFSPFQAPPIIPVGSTRCLDRSLRRNGSWSPGWSLLSEAFSPLAPFSLRCTSSSPPSGRTRYTMSMASCS